MRFLLPEQIRNHRIRLCPRFLSPWDLEDLREGYNFDPDVILSFKRMINMRELTSRFWECAPVPGGKTNLLDVNFVSHNWYLFVTKSETLLRRTTGENISLLINIWKMQRPPAIFSVYIKYWIRIVTFEIAILVTRTFYFNLRYVCLTFAICTK